ncbi:phosphocholine-specific phospholipase C [Phaeacidiphilus oryzae]|uniref:phosphocholine-specific phospholipase C n=1 Tax=Phaeacidiphilus oryzae TaxID=348818 RepID=UPI000561371C|nr:phospholipase C, phosphocholine-specific [Phaeacidiphilus oryzae]
MTDVNRRRFLGMVGGGAAATALSFTALSNSIARAASIPADRRTGGLDDIDHIVVLMQENRSFDHYFGSLRGVRGFGDPRVTSRPDGKPVWYQSNGSADVLPFHPDASDLGMRFLQDLPHGWSDTHEAFDQGRYDKWVPAKSSTSMAYMTRKDIPFQYALADAFTVCDAYHCSILSSTDPNRYYMWTGWVGNDGKGGGPVIDNAEKGYSWTTYPERLQQAGVSWKVYQDVGTGLDAAGSWGWTGDAYIGNYGDNSLLYFENYRNAAAGDPLYQAARTGTDTAADKDDLKFFDQLRQDVVGGKLPQVSYVVAPEAFCEHPNWPPNYGAWYVAKVLDALTADPKVWARTALFLTYDENDGFFDHMVPPSPASATAGGALPGGSTVDTSNEFYSPPAGGGYAAGPYGLGVRVPMVVISPWSTGGYVCSEVFDHTSIIRFMERRFGVAEPNITPWRRAVCGDLTSAFDFSGTDTAVPSLPSTDAYLPPDRNRHPDYVPVPPLKGSLPAQEPGTRPARALPYDPVVDGSVAADGTLTATLGNTGQATVVYRATSAAEPSAPRSYTVSPGRTLTGSWPAADGSYQATVTGPNGFARGFAGKAGAKGPEITARTVRHQGIVRLNLVNHGSRPVRLTVTDGYGKAAPATYSLAPGARAVHTASTAPTHGWYDLKVTSSTDPGYLRHAAGHLENGTPSISDPHLGGA